MDTMENILYALDFAERQYQEQIEGCSDANVMEIIRHEFAGAKKLINVIRSIIGESGKERE